jgi:hypothetical protein
LLDEPGRKKMQWKKYGGRRLGQNLVANRVIICDEPFAQSKRGKLHNLKTVDGKGFTLLNDRSLSESLEEMLCEALAGICVENTLIVFPGDGAQHPRKHSRILREFTQVEVPAGRLWSPGSRPIACTGAILPDRFLDLNCKLIVVVDDVISSGATMQALHRGNAWRFPRARWLAATWVSQHSRACCRSGLKGYDIVLSVCVVSKFDGNRAAINSLSTLRAEPELAQAYARRHLTEEHREKFLQCLEP